MKYKICSLLLLSSLFFASCKENNIDPDIKTNDVPKQVTSSVGLNETTASTDTAAVDVNGYLRIQLAKDSINSDNIMIDFNPTARMTYYGAEDAPTMKGFGSVALSSFSSDNIPLSINAVPLSHRGLRIALKVSGKTDGTYQLNMQTINSLPDNYQVLLVDSYKKDSVDFRKNPAYSFDLKTADTSSYGSNRFKVVVRGK